MSYFACIYINLVYILPNKGYRYIVLIGDRLPKPRPPHYRLKFYT